MSQATKTTLGSCGLMVGRNMAPPPPGPTTRHRGEPVSEREAGQRRSKQRAVKPARAWSAVRVMCLLEKQSGPEGKPGTASQFQRRELAAVPALRRYSL